MTTIFEISQGERALWQRRAAAEPGRMLAARPDLPYISWTVGPAGSVVVGRISGLARACQVRRIFEAWRAALDLEEYPGHDMSGGTAWLHAAVRRHEVRIRLSATVFPDYDAED